MFRFFGKYRTLPDLKVKSKIYFGVVSKNGGKSEDAQEQLLRKLLKQHYSGITVALFIQCGRKNPDAHSCRHNRHYSAADAAFGRNAAEHEKGAFTGAVARRIGKFEEASGGTLLLDEISETDVKIQAKLLRAIQEKEIDRIGGKAPIKVDTRIIATSNRNLDECVKNGTFRQDLYYRLNVVNINIPPLKDRPDDIIVLAKHFAKKYSELNDIPLKEMTPAAEQKLLNYLWPGNVRELENTVHRAVLLSTGDKIDADAILLDDIDAVINPAAGTEMSGAEFVGSTVACMERNLIIDTLKHTMGNRTTAANILGISIRTLRNKLKQYQDEGFEVPGL